MIIINNRHLEDGSISSLSHAVADVKVVTIYTTEDGMEAHVVRTDGSTDFIPLAKGEALCVVE